MITAHGVSGDSQYFQRDDYYSNEAQNTWTFGAENLKENFDVDLDRIGETRVFDQLVEAGVGSKDMVGQDITFSAPKDVSLLGALGSKEQQEIAYQAHRQAVERTLEYIDRNNIYTRETHNGETVHVAGHGIAAIAFDHQLSRDRDPQMHTHVVLLNQATRETDGQVRAIDFAKTLRGADRRNLDQIYQSEMSRYLQEHGIRTEWARDGKDFHIVGISDEQRKEFSQRRQEIEKNIQEKGRDINNDRDRQQANLETRRSKGTTDFSQLRQEWQERAQSVGLDVQRTVEENRLSQERIADIRQNYELRAESDAARQVMGDMQGVFDKTEFFAQVAELAHMRGQEFSLEQSEQHLAYMQERGQIVSLGQVSGREMFTTREFLQAERYLANSVNKDMQQGAFVSREQFQADMEEFREQFREQNGFWLSDEQEQALEKIYTSDRAINGIQGYAGVGKSALFRAANEYGRWLGERYGEDRAVHFVGMAPTGQAAKVLEESSGIRSATIHATLNQLERNGRITHQTPAQEAQARVAQSAVNRMNNRILRNAGMQAVTAQRQIQRQIQSQTTKKDWNLNNVQNHGRTVFVMDEAGMADSRLLANVVRAANNAGARLVLSGDTNQFQSVGAGRAFEMMQRRGMDTARITNIRRQSDPEVRNALRNFADGNVKPLQDLIQNRGWVHEQDRENMNNAIRERYVELLGRVENDPSRIMVLAQTNRTVEQLNADIREYLVENGIVSKDGVKIEIERNRQNTYIGRDIAKNESVGTATFQIGERRTEEREFAAGDRIVFLKNDRGLGVQNGLQGTVLQVDSENNTMRVKTDGDKENVVNVNYEQYRQFDHAYAVTEHKSQGATVTHAIVAHEGGANANATYVAMTRAREETHVFTADREQFNREMTVRQENRSALELSEVQDRESTILNASSEEMQQIENEIKNDKNLSKQERERTVEAYRQAWDQVNRMLSGTMTQQEFNSRWDDSTERARRQAFHEYYHVSIPEGRIESEIQDREFFRDERAFAYFGGRFEAQDRENNLILQGRQEDWEREKVEAAIYQRTLHLQTDREHNEIVNTGVSRETLNNMDFDELRDLYTRIRCNEYNGEQNGREVLVKVDIEGQDKTEKIEDAQEKIRDANIEDKNKDENKDKDKDKDKDEKEEEGQGQRAEISASAE